MLRRRDTTSRLLGNDFATRTGSCSLRKNLFRVILILSRHMPSRSGLTCSISLNITGRQPGRRVDMMGGRFTNPPHEIGIIAYSASRNREFSGICAGILPETMRVRTECCGRNGFVSTFSFGLLISVVTSRINGLRCHRNVASQDARARSGQPGRVVKTVALSATCGRRRDRFRRLRCGKVHPVQRCNVEREKRVTACFGAP